MMLSVDKLKMLVGIAADDTSKNAVLEFILEEVEEVILNYCNLKKLPEGLKNTAYRMAIDLYRNENIGSPSVVSSSGDSEAGGGQVASITEGGVSVSFVTNSAATQANAASFARSIMKDYTSTLNRYRRMDW